MIKLSGDFLLICKEYGAIPFIELKIDDIAEVIEEACHFFNEENVIISSFSEEHLYMVRELSKKVFVHHIFSNYEVMLELGELGYSGVSYNFSNHQDLPDTLLNKTHAAGVLLCLRGGDDIETVREKIQMGLDYIPTNSVYCLDA